MITHSPIFNTWWYFRLGWPNTMRETFVVLCLINGFCLLFFVVKPIKKIAHKKLKWCVHDISNRKKLKGWDSLYVTRGARMYLFCLIHFTVVHHSVHHEMRQKHYFEDNLLALKNCFIPISYDYATCCYNHYYYHYLVYECGGPMRSRYAHTTLCEYKMK